MNQAISNPAPLDLRVKLEEMVLNDLLGPADGPEEVLDEQYVHDRYVVGLLAPKGHSALPEEQDDLAVAGEDTEDGTVDSAVPKAATMLPSSIGMTFSVDADATALKVTARWGHYERVESETLTTKSGEPRKVWQREQVEGILEPLPLRPGLVASQAPHEDYPDVTVQGLCRRHDDQWTITLFLVNGQSEPDKYKDTAWLFQPELIVEAPDGWPIFRKRALRLNPAQAEPDELALEMLYRKRVEFAAGHGVSVHADLASGSYDKAIRITTRVIPRYEVPRVTPPSVEEIPDLVDLVLDMKTLAKTPNETIVPSLEPLVRAYAAWIDRQEQRAQDPAQDLLPYATAAQDAITQCRDTLKRLQEGLNLLVTSSQAVEAFRFMNEAMWLQRIHSLYSEQIRRGEEADLEDVDSPQNRSWYPFQLAFILLNLPGVTDLHHPNRSQAAEAVADLLWFPTGGGKTEAYLGLSAYTMGLRRLQGTIDGRSGMSGVAVLMRYTLRVLTLQQFQRATTLICACEDIRRRAIIAGDNRWGEEPFRIGIWVGQRTTPNSTEECAEAVKQHHGHYAPGLSRGGQGSPHQLTNCPWCGATIDPDKHIRVETVKAGRGRTFTYCGDPLGRCPFSQKAAPDEGLPVLVVDEEIYRRLPTLLIATVDKFAQMPWRGPVQMLFGQVTDYCPRHGFRSPEIEDSDSHPKKGKLPPVRSVQVSPLRPPDLIIQDELHLISGPLGTLVGLYETAVDQLASWQCNGKIVRPKVIASTATIRRAPDQVHALFLRQVKIFPPHGLDIEDNFFSRQRPPSPEHPGRVYLGLCAPGVRLKTTMIRTYVAAMAAAQSLFDDREQDADPWMTLVGYFNAMRELGGMRRLVEDAVRSRLTQMDERGLGKRFLSPWGVEELTSRRSATEIPEILDRLEKPFRPGDRELRKRRVESGEKTDSFDLPIDVLLATNMISVGVDVKRLGLMVVAGQPKTTAEYIQATSRIGRNYPGLVLTVLNWSRPRDLSHYERFEHYHATFYQHVEALSVTPFSPRALDRGLTGVFVSEVRLPGPEFNENPAAGRIDRDHDYVKHAMETIAHRAGMVSGKQDIGQTVKQELRARMDKWLVAVQRTTGTSAQLGYRDKKDGRTIGLLKQPGAGRWQDFTCPTSLREVEPDVRLIFRDYGLDDDPEATNQQEI